MDKSACACVCRKSRVQILLVQTSLKSSNSACRLLWYNFSSSYRYDDNGENIVFSLLIWQSADCRVAFFSSWDWHQWDSSSSGLQKIRYKAEEWMHNGYVVSPNVRARTRLPVCSRFRVAYHVHVSVCWHSGEWPCSVLCQLIGVMGLKLFPCSNETKLWKRKFIFGLQCSA